jgi:1,4-alpha-glucan branching enzyme
MTRLVNGGVEFRFYRPGANGVSVAGSFNKWDAAAHPMRKLAGGWWSAMLHLPAGEYQFRYLADGRWYTDYAAFGIERSRDQWNSVLFVPEVPEMQAIRKAA